MRITILLILCVGAIHYLCGQVYVDGSFDEQIKSVRIYIEGNELSYPVITEGMDQQLHFEFDDLSNELNNYAFEIIHCNADWTKSNLYVDEYIDGFYDNNLANYEYSNNTTVPYVHYQIVFPNDNINFLVSGNYIIQVKESISQKIVAQARFSINESIVNVRGEIVRPIGAEYANIGQELRMSVLHEDLEVNDPFGEIKVSIAQNNRPDRLKADIKPMFVRNNELVYGVSGEQIFLAGNEFRTFDIKNFKALGLNVNDVQFVDTQYFVQLRLDERRSSRKYFWDEEMNGKYTIYVNNAYDHELTADYAKVFFELSMPEPFLDGKVYVVGKFNHWQRNEQSLMEYNFDSHAYEAQIDLKQGYYDYCYVFVNNYDNKPTDQRIEGSHYQTENDYVIKVYHRSFGEQYDRMVGYRVINSKFQ